jgi:2-polyprenyl-3-methyl-5-hydroxy-6-metoxy-1,4-benzoquinol methylase
MGKQPSLELFFQTLSAYQRTEALKAAIELDLFTAIGEGNRKPAALAARCGASERGIRILCDYLVTIGILMKTDGNYDLTPDSAMFLDKRAPTYVGSAVRFLGSPMITDNFRNLADAVRKGGTASGEGTTAPEHPVWIDFARAMAPVQGLPARLLVELAGPGLPPNPRILDIAAGHGVFGIAFAQRYPEARVTALDWANVLEVAKENATKAGVANRYRTIAGSALEADYGGSYDLVLVTNFLHHFSPATCEDLLRRVRAALADKGRVLVLDFVPNADRVSPTVAAQFSLTMLAGTAEGDAYTYPEFQKMFANAGFPETTLHPLPPTFYSALMSRK